MLLTLCEEKSVKDTEGKTFPLDPNTTTQIGIFRVILFDPWSVTTDKVKYKQLSLRKWPLSSSSCFLNVSVFLGKLLHNKCKYLYTVIMNVSFQMEVEEVNEKGDTDLLSSDEEGNPMTPKKAKTTPRRKKQKTV
jgi:hypothetical protein